MEFEGESFEIILRLPFTPQFYVVDYDKELSDAATVGEAHLPGNGAATNLQINHISLRSAAPADVYVEHHWGTPHGDLPYGAKRMAQRYWMLRGSWEKEAGVRGSFRYVRGNRSDTQYPNLDQGFLEAAETCDSLALLYRPDPISPWRLASFTREGNTSQGYLVADSLLPGEYTLAVVDSVHIGIPTVPTLEANLFPNPLDRGQALTVDVPTEAPFSVSIFDEEGRQVWRKEGVASGQKLWPTLAKGTYFVLIENKFLSLHSKLIAL